MAKRSDPAYDIAAKILLIGEAGTGKSHLILRYGMLMFLFIQKLWFLVDNIFEPQLVKCTVQPDVKSKDLNVHDKKVRLRIWDTAGSERFRAINRAFFRNALGALVVYDISGSIDFDKNQNNSIFRPKNVYKSRKLVRRNRNKLWKATSYNFSW